MKIINIFFGGLGLVALILTLTHPARAQDDVHPIAPYIVKDTDNDSPGTNNVTRIVTIKAEIGGTPPIALQWKLDKGNGFEDIPGATNATYRIGNAQIPDTG